MTSAEVVVTNREPAVWIKRPGREPGTVYYYRRPDGRLFKGLPPDLEQLGESVYTSANFLPAAPLKVYFDFTNRCNLSCRHCITSSSPTVDTSNELRTSRITELVREMADMGCLELATGGGMPSRIGFRPNKSNRARPADRRPIR